MRVVPIRKYNLQSLQVHSLNLASVITGGDSLTQAYILGIDIGNISIYKKDLFFLYFYGKRKTIIWMDVSSVIF